MRRFTGFQLGTCLLGALLLVTGVAMALHPTEVDVSRPGSLKNDAKFEHVSKTGVQFAGGFTALAGLGFLWGALSRRSS